MSIMANDVIRNLVVGICGGFFPVFFALIADEYTDMSNKEQLTICIRWIEHLEVSEDFLVFF